MTPSSIKLAYFSPTNTTRKVLEAIAQGVGVNDVEHINFTLSDYAIKALPDMNDTLVLFGAPVYAGRLPPEAVKRLSSLKGNHTPAVVVVVYGNRAYEDALLELKDLAVALGFVPVAGGAFIGEHSYTSPETPIAEGRPNNADLEKALAFGHGIWEKLSAIEKMEPEMPITVPGNFPYKTGMPPSDECAQTLEDTCTLCGTCAYVCPTAAITLTDHVQTDAGACILCCACVKNCPTQARIMPSPRIKKVAKWLSENCATPGEPEMFI
jgi:ferredoxin